MPETSVALYTAFRSSIRGTQPGGACTVSTATSRPPRAGGGQVRDQAARAADGTFACSGTVRVADSCLSGGQACPRGTHRTSRRMGTRASYRLVIFGPTYTTYSGSAACTGHEK